MHLPDNDKIFSIFIKRANVKKILASFVEQANQHLLNVHYGQKNYFRNMDIPC